MSIGPPSLEMAVDIGTTRQGPRSFAICETIITGQISTSRGEWRLSGIRTNKLAALWVPIYSGLMRGGASPLSLLYSSLTALLLRLFPSGVAHPQVPPPYLISAARLERKRNSLLPVEKTEGLTKNVRCRHARLLNRASCEGRETTTGEQRAESGFNNGHVHATGRLAVNTRAS